MVTDPVVTIELSVEDATTLLGLFDEIQVPGAYVEALAPIRRAIREVLPEEAVGPLDATRLVPAGVPMRSDREQGWQ